jgi:hypothetical protein
VVFNSLIKGFFRKKIMNTQLKKDWADKSWLSHKEPNTFAPILILAGASITELAVLVLILISIGKHLGVVS